MEAQRIIYVDIIDEYPALGNEYAEYLAASHEFTYKVVLHLKNQDSVVFPGPYNYDQALRLSVRLTKERRRQDRQEKQDAIRNASTPELVKEAVDKYKLTESYVKSQHKKLNKENARK